METSISSRKRFRKRFGQIKEILDMPNLIQIQRESYEDFLQIKVDPNNNIWVVTNNLGLKMIDNNHNVFSNDINSENYGILSDNISSESLKLLENFFILDKFIESFINI